MANIKIPRSNPQKIETRKRRGRNVRLPVQNPRRISNIPPSVQAPLWTPTQLGSDLALWLDVWDSSFGLRTDANGNDRVERWGDLSGNGNDAVQGAGSKQPILQADRVNFDTGWMTVNSEIRYLLILTNDFKKGGGDTYLFDYRPPGGNGYLNSNYYKGDGWYLDGGSVRNGGVVDAFGGNHLVYDTQPATSGKSYIATYASNTRNRSRGGLSLIVGVVGSSPRRQLEGWAAHKADRNGISEPLDNMPDSHPYKTEAPTI